MAVRQQSIAKEPERQAAKGPHEQQSPVAPAIDGLLLAAFGSLPDAYALFDGEDRLVVANRGFRDMFLHLSDLMEPGVSFAELARASAERGQFASAQGGGVWQLRLPEADRLKGREFKLNDGRWIRANDYPLDGGGILSARVDVTTERRAELFKRDAAEQIQIARSSRTEFLANMSHELRTPLNAIMGFSSIMLNEMFGPMNNAYYQDYMKDILDSSTLLLGIISDILDVARIEAGKIDLDEHWIDVSRLIAASLRLVEDRARDRKITIDIQLDEDLPELFADERAIKQVLLNLLTNAVKFTPEGGRITVGASADGAATLTLVVADTGIGITADDIPRVLVPFHQVQGAFSRDHPGAGLGLTIVQTLLATHGATLDIQSEIGAGSTISARFPRHRVGWTKIAAEAERVSE